jgi:hypothetical protein
MKCGEEDGALPGVETPGCSKPDPPGRSPTRRSQMCSTPGAAVPGGEASAGAVRRCRLRREVGCASVFKEPDRAVRHATECSLYGSAGKSVEDGKGPRGRSTGLKASWIRLIWCSAQHGRSSAPMDFSPAHLGRRQIHLGRTSAPMDLPSAHLGWRRIHLGRPSAQLGRRRIHVGPSSAHMDRPTIHLGRTPEQVGRTSRELRIEASPRGAAGRRSGRFGVGEAGLASRRGV